MVSNTPSNTEQNRMVPLDIARGRLAWIWMAGSLAAGILLAAQSFGNVYKGRLAEVWSAAIPMVLPTLSLIITVVGDGAIETTAESGSPRRVTTMVNKTMYHIAVTLSIAYFLAIGGTFLGEPAYRYFNSPRPTETDILSAATHKEPVTATKSEAEPIAAADVLKVANLWLAPLQTLVVASMSKLFFKKQS
jgi:hypothetical protein